MSQATNHPLDSSAQRRALLEFLLREEGQTSGAVGAPLA